MRGCGCRGPQKKAEQRPADDSRMGKKEMTNAGTGGALQTGQGSEKRQAPHDQKRRHDWVVSHSRFGARRAPRTTARKEPLSANRQKYGGEWVEFNRPRFKRSGGHEKEREQKKGKRGERGPGNLS